jgi:hypothetical protein
MGKLLEMNVSLGSKMVGPTVSSPHFTNAGWWSPGDKNSSVCY